MAWKVSREISFSDLEKFYGEGLPKIILYSKKGEIVFTINKGAWKINRVSEQDLYGN
ncbi:MAG: hypothetical protein IPI10_19125 [Bacteroidetes bacterium]|nr:hypothetical protein [Bacteroidota bacterium]